MTPRRLSSRFGPILGVAAGVCLAALAACAQAADEQPTSAPFTLPQTTVTTAPVQTAPPTTEPAPQEYAWQVGDCVDLGTAGSIDLPYAPYGTDLLIDCTEPHTHELFFRATLQGAPGALYPEDLNNTLFDICFQEFHSWMGYFASESLLDLILYLPDDVEWAAGERYHACVVYRQDPEAAYRHLVGSVADTPDDYRWELTTGECFDLDDPFMLRAVSTSPCEEIHTLEMIGEVTHPAPAGAAYPGRELAIQFAQEACGPLLEEYAAQPLGEVAAQVLGVPFVLSQGEWDLGKRTLRCFAFVFTPTEGLFNLVGSFAGDDFEIVGLREDEGISA